MSTSIVEPRTDEPGADKPRTDPAPLLVQSKTLDDSSLGHPYLEPLNADANQAVVAIENPTASVVPQATVGTNPAFDLIGLTQLRNDPRFASIDGSNVSVAVLDTGLAQNHPFLAPNYITGFDFVDGDAIPNDANGHGTHVAGTVGAADENLGVATDVGLIGLRVLGGNSDLPIRNALQWVLDNQQQHNIVAVNMSLGIPELFLTSEDQISGGIQREISTLIDRLEAAGVTVITAAGNDYVKEQRQGISAPGIFSTLNVGAVWQNDYLGSIPGAPPVRWQSGAIDFDTGQDFITSFSQRIVSDTTIFAPGALINSTVPQKDGRLTGFQGGTSQATPHVAGAVALMQEAAFQFGGRYLSPEEVVEIIRFTADRIFDGADSDRDGIGDDNVVNTNVFYPRLNVFNAVEEIFNRFQATGGTPQDPNGTLQGAFIGPRLNGFPVNAIPGTIGTDGGVTVVGNTDVDIYRFDVLSPGSVTIEVESDRTDPDDFDTLLRLFDASGTQLDLDDDSGTGTFSKLNVFLNPGTYYAGISGFDNSGYDPRVAGSGVAAETGNYSLQFSLNNADPNGLLSGAVPISLGNSRDPFISQAGSIGADFGAPVGVADVDLFKITVPDNGTLFIDIDTPFIDGFVDSFLRLFDDQGNVLRSSNGTPLASDDDLSFNATGTFTEYTDPRFPNLTFEDPVDRRFFLGHTTDSFLGVRVERGDVYYVGVSDFFNDSYNPKTLRNRPTTGAGGQYNLQIEFINNDLNGSIDQAIQNVPLPLVNQAGTIGTDTQPQTAAVQPVGDLDVDFVKINAPQAGILEVDIDSFTGVASGAIANPVDAVLLIFDGDGTLLAKNDDTDDLDPRIQYQIQANTDYYVAIAGVGNDSFDPFLLGSGAPGDTGNYIFNSRLLPTTALARFSDGFISSQAIADLTLGDSRLGDIGTDGSLTIGAADIDLYRFTPTSTGVVDIRTFTEEAFSADTVLRLFDASGQELAFNDDDTSLSSGSFIQASVVANQTYFIGVNGFSPQARAYDPVTGGGAAPGSEGSYVVTLSAPAGRPNPGGGGNGDGGNGGGGNSDGGNSDGGNGNGGVNGGGGNDNGGNDTPPIVRKAPDNGLEVALIGDSGKDRLTGGPGNDRLIGNGGGDRLNGKGGNDRISGGAGNDRLIGGGGNDRLNGGTGKDILLGGNGRDRLIGGGGSDRLDGGKGNDIIVTGGGRDRIVIRRGQGIDRIRDFQDNTDKIDLKGLTFSQLTLQARNNDVLVKARGQNLLRIEDVAVSAITQNDFV